MSNWRAVSFSPASTAGQNPYAALPYGGTAFPLFSSNAPAWPKTILSGHAITPSYYAAAGVARRASVSRQLQGIQVGA
jgi:hypothetical protein